MAEHLPREPLPLLAVPAGSVVVRQGEDPGRLHVVAAGAFVEFCSSLDGRELIMDVLGPGDLVGTFDRPAESTVRALRPSRLRPAATSEVPNLLSARERRALKFARDLAWLDVTARLERRLEDLAGRFGRRSTDGLMIDLFLRQEDLAALVGATRESANRAIRVLRGRGRLRSPTRGRYVLPPQLLSVGS